MWRLEFLPSDSHSWVDSLPLGGYPMLGEPFDNARQASTAANAIAEIWPDLRVRIVMIETQNEE